MQHPPTTGYARTRCPSCGTPHLHPAWPEAEAEPVLITLHCSNPSCRTIAFEARER